MVQPSAKSCNLNNLLTNTLQAPVRLYQRTTCYQLNSDQLAVHPL